VANQCVSYFLLRGPLEQGRRWFERALAVEPSSPSLRGRTLLNAARLALAVTDLDDAVAKLAGAAALLRAEGDARRLGQALRLLAATLADRGELARAEPLYEEALALGIASGSTPSRVNALRSLGRLALQRGRLAEARARLEEALALAEASRELDAHGVGGILDALSVVHDRAGEAGAVRDLIERARALFERLGAARELGYMTLYEAYLESRPPGGEDGLAARVEPLVALFERTGDARGAGWTRNALGRLAARAGALDRAERHLDAALRTFRRLQLAAGIVSALGSAADLALARRDPAAAEALLDEAAAILARTGERLYLPQIVDRMAATAGAAGDLARAALLMGAAAGARQALRFVAPASTRPEREALAERLRAGLGEGAFAAAEARGRALAAEAPVDLAVRLTRER
jgi:tetratricopeptide (TPR) repeat protein